MADAATLPSVPPVSMTLKARDPKAFADALGASFERFGFAIVCDHGLDPGLIEAAHKQVKAFFAQPEEVKRAYHLKGISGQRGYIPFGVEAAKGADKVDLKEFWHVGRELPAGHPYRADMPDNVWPAELPEFRAKLYGLYQALDALGEDVLSSIATYLGLPERWFDRTVKDGNSVLRLLHYPPVPAKAEGVRAEAHEDINTITLLLGAEEAGLQLLDRDGRWLDINPPDGAIVINIGDMLQRLTNHKLPSTTHRVVNPAPERAHLPRYSIPFFLHFAPDFVIDTLPNCVDAAHPNRYPTPLSAQDYLMERLKEIRLA